MTAPEHIYLQDAGDYDCASQFEVTWCVEPQDDADTKYIRNDLAAQIRADALREAAKVIGDQYRKAMALSDRDLTHDGKSYAAAAYGWSEQAIIAMIDKPKGGDA